MKKKAIVISALTVAIALAMLTTLAFFTATDTAKNTITLGSVDIEVHEWILVQEGDGQGEYQPWPEEGVTAMPNDNVSKYVSVENTGAHPVWVRLSWTQAMTVKEKPAPEGWKDFVKIIPRSEEQGDWIEKEDGYWYYVHSLEAKTDDLEPGNETTKLKLKVTFLPGLGNDYQGAVYALTVEAQAVQYEHNFYGDLGWPESQP